MTNALDGFDSGFLDIEDVRGELIIPSCAVCGKKGGCEHLGKFQIYHPDKHLGVWCKKTGLGIRSTDTGKACTWHISEAREKEFKRIQAERRFKKEEERKEAERIISRAW